MLDGEPDGFPMAGDDGQGKDAKRGFLGVSRMQWLLCLALAALFRYVIVPWWGGPSLEYEVLKRDLNGFHGIFKIVIEEPKGSLPSEDELEEIYSLYDYKARDRQKFVVDFYLPGMELDTPFATASRFEKRGEVELNIHEMSLGLYPQYHRFADKEWIDREFQITGETAEFSR